MSHLRKILFVTADPLTAAVLLRGQLSHLRSAGFEVEVATSPGRHLDEVAKREGVKVWPVPIARNPRPWRDLLALVRMIRVLRQTRPSVINASTPKGALVGLMAARLCGVPERVYLLRGLRLEGSGGGARKVLRWAEKVAMKCAHQIVCVSPSLRDRVVEEGLVSVSQLTVLGSGSSNGVDSDRFAPIDSDARPSLRATLGLPTTGPVIGFVGRLTLDKGIVDFAEIVERLIGRLDDLHVLLVGEVEEDSAALQLPLQRLEATGQVVAPGFVAEPVSYYQVMDVLVFPSYREGFPNAPLEAAACGVPTAGYFSTGTIDAVEDGVTGTLVTIGDRESLAEATLRYLEDPDLRARHARQGRDRVVSGFRQEEVWRRWVDFYSRDLAGPGTRA